MQDLKELIEELQERKDAADTGDYEGYSWGYELGVLISGRTADGILEYLKKFDSDAFQETLEIQQTLFDVIKEYNKAKKGHPETDNFDVNKMALVVSEEAGEVSKAVLQYQDEGGSKEAIRDELVQTAAMCLRMLLNLNKY